MLMIYEGTENPEVTVETLNFFLERCNDEQTRREIMNDIQDLRNKK